MKAYLSINADHTLADWPTFGQDAYKAAVARHQRAAEAEARRILAETEPGARGGWAGDDRYTRRYLRPAIVVPALAESLSNFINLEVS